MNASKRAGGKGRGILRSSRAGVWIAYTHNSCSEVSNASRRESGLNAIPSTTPGGTSIALGIAGTRSMSVAEASALLQFRCAMKRRLGDSMSSDPIEGRALGTFLDC